MVVIKKLISEIIIFIKVVMDGMIFCEVLLLYIFKWVGGYLGYVCMWFVLVFVEVKFVLVGWDGVVCMVVIFLFMLCLIFCLSCKLYIVYRINNFLILILLLLCFFFIKKNLMYFYIFFFKYGCCWSFCIVFLYFCVYMFGLYLVWIC